MDDKDAGAQQNEQNLECRPPLQADLVNLCDQLNRVQVQIVKETAS